MDFGTVRKVTRDAVKDAPPDRCGRVNTRPLGAFASADAAVSIRQSTPAKDYGGSESGIARRARHRHDTKKESRPAITPRRGSYGFPYLFYYMANKNATVNFGNFVRFLSL